MNKTFLLSILIFALSANACLADTGGQTVFKSLSELLLGGTWVTNAEGETVKHTYAQAGNGKFLRNEMKGGPLQGTAVVGVNPKDNVCTWWAYLVDGSIATMTIRQEKEGVLLMESTPGSPARYKGRITRVDENTIKEETIEMIVGGEKQSPGYFMWKRINSSTAADAWLEYLVGSWEFEMEDGKKGRTTYRSAGSTPALVFDAAAGDFSILGVIGWRADQNMLVETDFHTERKGVNGNLNRQFSDITLEAMKGIGKFWESSGQSDSQPLEYRRVSDDEMTLTGRESKNGGIPWVVKFKRTREREIGSDAAWEDAEWKKLIGVWRADYDEGGYRIKRITKGKEIYENYDAAGELILKTKTDMSISRREGLNFFTVTNRVELFPEEDAKGAGVYESIYRVHDGKWYEQMWGIFSEAEDMAPDKFLIYSRVHDEK